MSVGLWVHAATDQAVTARAWFEKVGRNVYGWIQGCPEASSRMDGRPEGGPTLFGRRDSRETGLVRNIGPLFHVEQWPCDEGEPAVRETLAGLGPGECSTWNNRSAFFRVS